MDLFLLLQLSGAFNEYASDQEYGIWMNHVPNMVHSLDDCLTTGLAYNPESLVFPGCDLFIHVTLSTIATSRISVARYLSFPWISKIKYDH